MWPLPFRWFLTFRIKFCEFRTTLETHFEKKIDEKWFEHRKSCCGFAKRKLRKTIKRNTNTKYYYHLSLLQQNEYAPTLAHLNDIENIWVWREKKKPFFRDNFSLQKHARIMPHNVWFIYKVICKCFADFIFVPLNYFEFVQ